MYLVLLGLHSGDPAGEKQVNSGGPEQDLVSEGLGPSETKEATSPEGSSNQSDVLQSSGVSLVSAQALSDEGSHIGTDTGEVTGTAQVGGQSGGEGVLETVGQESKVEELDVGGLGENSGSSQKGSRNAKERHGLLLINFKGLGFRDEGTGNDGSANVCHNALSVEKKLGSRGSRNSACGTNGRVCPGTGDGGGSHLCSFNKPTEGDTVDGTGIEGEKHSHTYRGLLRKRNGLDLDLGRHGEDILGIDWGGLASVRRRKAAGHGQIAGEKQRKKLHRISEISTFKMPRRTLKSRKCQREHWSTTLGYTKAIHSGKL